MGHRLRRCNLQRAFTALSACLVYVKDRASHDAGWIQFAPNQHTAGKFGAEICFMNNHASILSAFTLTLLVSVSASAQQTTGVPGSPDATTTIDGRYLPPPPQPFQGEINLNAAQSKPALAGARRATQGCPQHPAHHDRRRGLRSAVHFWGRRFRRRRWTALPRMG